MPDNRHLDVKDSSRPGPVAWVAIGVGALITVIAIVMAFVALTSDSESTTAVAPAPLQPADPAPSAAPETSPAGQSTAPPPPAAAQPTAPPAQEVETVPVSSSDVIIQDATVDANGTVTVYGYTVETGLTAEEIEALVTYADEVIASLPVATDGQSFWLTWKPGDGSMIRDLASRGAAAELGKYQLQVKDVRHPSAPASVGFKGHTPQVSVPQGGGADIQIPDGGNIPRPGGGRR